MAKPVAPPSKGADKLGFKPRKFWKTVSVSVVPGGWEVHLDGRSTKTPAGQAVVLPSQALAEAIACEWEAIVDIVDYERLPLSRLAFAAIDRMPAVEAETLAEIGRYAETDLVCYPSEYPQALLEREQAAWGPVLAWADATLDLQFHIRQSVIHQPQPPETVDRLLQCVAGMSAWEQAGLMSAVPLFGSVVLALAVWKGHLGGPAAFAASRVGEDFQSETWGDDAEAAKRVDGMKAQALALEVWFRTLA